MLEKIGSSDIEVIGENNDVKLFGVKFYNKTNYRNFVEDLSEKINGGEPLDGMVELFKN